MTPAAAVHMKGMLCYRFREVLLCMCVVNESRTMQA